MAEERMPRFLYKYRAVNHHSLDLLSTGHIYFASIEQFNDPFEGHILPILKLPAMSGQDFLGIRPQLLRGVRWELGVEIAYKDLLEFANDHEKKLNLKSLAESVVGLRQRIVRLNNSEFSNLLEQMEPDGSSTWDGNKESKTAMRILWLTSSVFTLAEESDNILMWSHYAESHRGFCLEFDRQKLSKFQTTLRKVQYSDSYPEVEVETYPNIWEDPDAVPKWMKLLFTKASQWCYEKEWRIIRNRECGTEEIDPGAITAVILGCRMPFEHKALLKRIMKGRNVAWREAVPRERSFKLDVRSLATT